MNASDEMRLALRCIDELRDADLTHHLFVVARTLRDIQREREQAAQGGE